MKIEISTEMIQCQDMKKARFKLPIVFRDILLLGLATILFWGIAGADDNLELGNPSNAGSTDKNNLLVEHTEYALSYNKSQGEANWVSWHLNRYNVVKAAKRKNNFRRDPILPADMQIVPNDYKKSGYDKGHMCPAGDRTYSETSLSDTFFMSNMLPQTPTLNRELWRHFEDYCRSQLNAGTNKYNELYIISGGIGSARRIAGGKINVPTYCWKVVVILPEGKNDINRVTAKTRVVAVLMPNQDSPAIAHADWHRYTTTIETVESLTHLDLLSKIPLKIQKILSGQSYNELSSNKVIHTSDYFTFRTYNVNKILLPPCLRNFL